jgi:quercetin dioxygenase-like cupin family protein
MSSFGPQTEQFADQRGCRRTPPAHIPFEPDAFRWRTIEPGAYKQSTSIERGMGWRGISRHVLTSSQPLQAEFEVRYFELQAGGFSSLEKHRHAHFVVALRGSGRALVGERLIELVPFDAVEVPPLVPHRWINDGEEPFGFLCTVGRDRDKPSPLDDREWEALRANPATAPYVF